MCFLNLRAYDFYNYIFHVLCSWAVVTVCYVSKHLTFNMAVMYFNYRIRFYYFISLSFIILWMLLYYIVGQFIAQLFFLALSICPLYPAGLFLFHCIHSSSHNHHHHHYRHHHHHHPRRHLRCRRRNHLHHA